MELSVVQLEALATWRGIYDEMNTLRAELLAMPQQQRLTALENKMTAALRGIQGIPA